MNALLRLRRMDQDDLPFADHLRALAGWNQTLEDWQRFLQLEPEGCFVAEWGGTPAGTATTITYGTDLAWIGMVLVLPELRRRGIGRALLEQCITYLRHRQVRCIKLDATPAGKQVYDQLGFLDEWTLTRWVSNGPNLRLIRNDPHISRYDPDDLPRLEALDTNAFGVSRRRSLQALIQQDCYAVVYETAPEQVEGYGLLRKGSQALYLGPMVANSADTAIRLAEALMTQSSGNKIYWDIPDAQTEIIHWCQQQGFSPQRSLTRMYLGQNSVPGKPLRQYAIAAPEIG